MLCAVLTIVLIYRIPFYTHWVSSKFGNEADRIYEQMQHLTREERMEARFGTTYAIERAVTKMLNAQNAANAIVLLPPPGFVSAMKIEAGKFEVPEPAVFYYFTGYRAVWKNSKDVYSANWALLLMQNRMLLKPIRSKQTMDTLLNIYKSYN